MSVGLDARASTSEMAWERNEQAGGGIECGRFDACTLTFEDCPDRYVRKPKAGVKKSFRFGIGLDITKLFPPPPIQQASGLIRRVIVWRRTCSTTPELAFMPVPTTAVTDVCARIPIGHAAASRSSSSSATPGGSMARRLNNDAAATSALRFDGGAARALSAL
eukprot:363711-Chlamydomonas_euryale.AAC.18